MLASFLKKLTRHFDLPVYPVDERLTTVEAKARLFEQGGYRSLRKSSMGGLSAQLIVESWLIENC